MADVPEIVLSVLDDRAGIEHELLETFTLAGSSYFVVQQTDVIGGGEAIVVRVLPDGAAIIADIDRAPGNLSTAGVTSFSMDYFSAPPSDRDLMVEAATERIDLDRVIARAAKDAVGDPFMDSDSGKAPGTNGGRLACAWAVNRLVKRCLGREIGGGLATANMYPILKNRHFPRPAASAPAGCIVISRSGSVNGRWVTGHVGILGDAEKIYSNSSGTKQWVQNFTKSSWSRYYGGLGLPIDYFSLNSDYFPGYRAAAVS